MSKITVVIEYADGTQEPSFHANMLCLGGIVVAVQFNDALEENEKLMSILDVGKIDQRGK